MNIRLADWNLNTFAFRNNVEITHLAATINGRSKASLIQILK